MGSIKYRIDMDFISSVIEYFNPSDIEMDTPWLEAFNNIEPLWKAHEDKLSFSNRNLLKSFGIANSFMVFIKSSIYLYGLQWLLELTEETLLKAMCVRFTKESKCDPEILRESIRQTLDGYYRSTPSDYVIFEECVQNPTGITESIRTAFTQAYEIYEKEIYEPNKETIKAYLHKMETSLADNPKTYLKRILLAGYERFEPKLETLEIYMIFGAMNWYSASFDPDYVTISYEMAERIEFNQPNERIVDFIKLISDSKRYEMMKLLSQKPHYGAEIAKALDLTTATVSHHLSKMTLLKLIDPEKGEKNRVYFRLNKSTLEEYLEMIKADILDQFKSE